MTMTLVSTVTVGAGGAASIDFTSIPQTGTDLLVVLSTKTTEAAATDGLHARFNNDSTGTNYSVRRLIGSGSAASSTSQTAGYANIGNSNGNSAYTGSTFANTALYIANYTSSSNKSLSADSVTENNATSAKQQLTAGLYLSSSGITSIKFITDFGTFDQYSTASLYTIQVGSGGATVS